MARLTKISLAVATLSTCLAAVSSGYPWWVQDGGGPTGIDIRGLCAINDSSGWAVAKNWKAYKRKVQGPCSREGWQDMSLGPSRPYHLNDVFFTNSLNGWIVGERRSGDSTQLHQGIVLRTTNGGQTWADQTQNIWPPLPLASSFYATRFTNVAGVFYGYIACGNGLVLRTTNGGDNWIPIGNYPSSQEDSLSESYKGLWVDPTNPDSVWVCGDNTGFVASTTDGGGSWTEHRPDCFNSYYAGPDLDGRLATFDLSPGSFSHVDVALCKGKIGRTTDGGSSWHTLDLGPEPTWFYGVTGAQGGDLLAMGNWPGCYLYPGGSEDISQWYTCDWLAVDAAPSSPFAYAAGLHGLGCPIGQRYDPVGFAFDTLLTESRPGTAIVHLEWHTAFERNIESFEVCRTKGNYLLDPYDGLGRVGTVAPQGPSSYCFVDTLAQEDRTNYCYQIRVATPDPQPYSDYDQAYWADSTGYINWLPGVPDIPDPPSNLQAQDVSGDHGHAIQLSWTASPSPGVEYLVGRSRSQSGPFVWITIYGTGSPTAYTDQSVETGVRYWYAVVARFTGHSFELSPYSNIASGVAYDSLFSGSILPLKAWYDSVNSVVRLLWQPVPSTSEPEMGGYWVCCPCLPPGKPVPEPPGTVLNASPIDRTWYNTVPDHGGDWGYRVGPMDRSGNFGGWQPDSGWVVVRVPYMSLAGNMKATGHNSAARMVRDQAGNTHAAFTFGDSVYYSWSPDEVYWDGRQAIGQGAYPAIDISGDTLFHVCWVNKSTQGDAELWHRAIDITSKAPGAAPSAPLFTASQSGYYGATPPSLDVDAGKARLAWQSLKIIPSISPPYPDPEDTVSLSGLGSFLLCGSFSIDNPSGFTYEEVDSFWQGSCTVRMDTLMEHTPSIAYNTTSPHIVWEKDGTKLRYYEKSGSQWLSEVISSTSAAHVKDPQIRLDGGLIHCVWTEKPASGYFNIFHRAKPSWGTPGQTDWFDVEQVCSTSGHSESPVFSKNNIAWHELSGSVTEVYLSQSRNLTWTNPQNISSQTYGDSKHPQIIYEESPYGQAPCLYMAWSQSHPITHTIEFRKKSVELTPIAAVNLGGEDSSPVTIQRDGYIHYGSEPHETVDYGDNLVKYGMEGLEGAEYEYKIRLLYYHEGSGRSIESDIDGIWKDTTWVDSSTVTWVEDLVPDTCLGDNKVTVTGTSLSSALSAEFGGFELCRYERGSGGGQSAGALPGLSRLFALYQNCPNPCRQSTAISYQLPRPLHSQLRIYDVTGRYVRTLVDERQKAGYYSLTWDGTGRSGKKVASGIYFYRLTAGDLTSTKKMVVLR